MPKVVFVLQPPTPGSFGEEHLKFKCSAETDNVIYEETDFDAHMTAHHPGHFYVVDSSQSGR